MMKTVYSIALVGLTATSVHAQAQVWQQCGGANWSGATSCVSGSACTKLNDYYSQCTPGAAAPPPPANTAPPPAIPTTGPSVPVPAGNCAPNSPPASAGKVQYAGINIAGFDFGCDTNGLCKLSDVYPPLAQYSGPDGVGQMQHFYRDSGFNLFRLPVGWQFLTNDQMSGTLNAANFQKYDTLVQACLATGATCVIDIHNYARFNGKIVGQGGPSNEIFAALWSSIASKYARNTKVIFGLMNEPHDVPDIEMWAATVQAAVTAIRRAGATSHTILLPGNNWTSAATFVSNGSGAALAKVTNPDGSHTGLVFDVHKYADADNSGTHADCVRNNIDDAFAPLAQWLRCNGRQAFNTEMGGGNTQSCVQMICEQVAFQNANSDVFLGYVGWGAGSFDQSYILGETPTRTGNGWADTLLVKSCLAPRK